MQCPINPFTRNLLRTIHSLSACGWIGGGLAVLVLLRLAGAPESSEQAEVFQRSITAIDTYLIIPSAGIATLSGLAICCANRWGLGDYVWIKEKCLLTALLLIFGALWLAPDLEALCPETMEGELDAGYFSQWFRGTVAALIQTAGLLLLVAISVLKPQHARWAKKGQGVVE